MASEHLTRKFHFRGDKQQWTFSFWAKRNADSEDSYVFTGGPDSQNKIEIYWRTDGQLWVEGKQGGNDGYQETNRCMRDPSQWYNFTVLADTALENDQERLQIWVNGVRTNSHQSNDKPGQNNGMFLGEIANYVFGKRSYSGVYSEVQMFDCYYVDGLALKPDNFGYNHYGRGSKSTEGGKKTTRISGGQWRPQKPSIIKKRINQSGGFGANGFYLPFSDGKHPGMDFHCDSNSIIKNPAEDNPQPKGGLPTTSDNYVSQLREDPFKDYIVLAVPGISDHKDYSADIKGSGSNKTGTWAGNAGTGVVYGLYGRALAFDGSNGTKVDYTHASDFNFGDDEFTCEYWIRYDDTNNSIYETALTTSETTDYQGVYMGRTSSNKFAALIQNSAGNGWTSTFDSDLAPEANQWYHVAFERCRNQYTLYVDGVAVYIADADFTLSNSNNKISIGGRTAVTGQVTDGFMNDIRVYKGVAKYKGGFEVPRMWNPVNMTLPGEDYRVVEDSTGNNFATFMGKYFGAGRQDVIAYSFGNLRSYHTATSGTDSTAVSTMACSKYGISKVYCEFRLSGSDSGLGSYIGVMKSSAGLNDSGTDTSQNADCWIVRGDNGNKSNNSGASGVTYHGSAWTNDSIIMLAVDTDNGKIWWGRNGTWSASGNPATGANPAFTNIPTDGTHMLIICGDNYSSKQPTIIANFGQNPHFEGEEDAGTNTDDNGRGLFKYDVPAGFLSLCSENMPTPAVLDPRQHFDILVWDGNNSPWRSIKGLDFKPDCVSLARLSDSGDNRVHFTSVRGPNKYVYLNTNGTEGTRAWSDGWSISSFNEGGFSIGSWNNINLNDKEYCAWCWKGGGQPSILHPYMIDGVGYINSSSASLDGGTITPSRASINTKAGFGMYEYTGESATKTISHGLGKEPKWIFAKRMTGSAQNWLMYHGYYGGHKGWNMNTNTQMYDDSGYWADTNPTSSLITIGNYHTGSPYMMYAFAEIEGYSKFGSYMGTGNSDWAPFIYCGFKPAMIICKDIETGNENWGLVDDTRSKHNPRTRTQYWSNQGGEQDHSVNTMDFYSNGFRLRTSDSRWNHDARRYIFMAFARSPFTVSNAE